MYMQQVLQTLNNFWTDKGCMLWSPYHTEVGAGTSNPATFLRVLGPEPWWVAYPEPSIRPADGRYGENPNRLQHYYQYQVILKPSPSNVQELFLQSLEALGLDLTKNDFRFVEDNWQSPSLGAWGLGWEAWLNGMEILQFTYFQQCGGVDLGVRACELTYGIERIAMYLQGAESVYDLVWAPSGITYRDIYHASEVEWCKYNFDHSDPDKLFKMFDMSEQEGRRLLDEGLVLPAYDQCLKLSHLFNLLDARGALSVTERGRFLLRCRAVAERCAKAFAAQREEMGYPLMRLPRPGKPDEGKPAAVDQATFKDKDTLLLEIGVEELPHSDVQAVIRQTPALIEKLLDGASLEHGPIRVDVTPRRIAITIQDMPSRQADVTKEARGPQKDSAKDANGNWTVAAQRFAAAHGARPEDIVFRPQGKAEYCFLEVHQKGQHIADLMSDIVEKLIRGLQFVKSMGWEDSTVTFSRPVRWILALHGETVVPVTWKLREQSEIGPARMLYSGRVTYGHRRLGPGAVTIARASEYRDKLKEAYVVVDRDERLAMLKERAAALCKPLGVVPEDDEDLVAEITDLLEWPEPIVCEIPEETLVLPEAITITPMKVYQRYIPLRTPDGALSKHFIAVANGEHSREGRDLIRAGNERVLHARLRDAAYFWETDTKTKLAEFAKGLARVTFHQDLGSVGDKIARLKALYGKLKGAFPAVDDAAMDQVLTLMKADLTTQMVGEFDSLEGVVGMLYAKKEGIDPAIADALFEHRLPRRADDKLPQNTLGIVAGLLDRFDTLAGYFGLGMRVKGTSDPFGLRRNTLAVLAIIDAAGLDLDIEACLRAALDNYGSLVKDADGALKAFLAFAEDRLAVMTRDKGYAYDVVAAALPAHATRPLCFRRCVDALRDLNGETLQDLAEQAKRIKRILDSPGDAVDEALLAEEERALYKLCRDSRPVALDRAAKGDFAEAVSEFLGWLPVISKYFEDVLVNDKNEAVKKNRHALLNCVLTGMTQVADVTAIEKEKKETA